MHSPSVAEISQPGVADLWCYFPESNPDPGLLAAQAALMSPDEQDRCGRFRFERERRMFVATRALVRTVLSSYFPVESRAWGFSADQHGKPAVKIPMVTPRIHFNLAHTDGLVVCVVSAACESIGVDAERLERGRDFLGETEGYFSSTERDALRACPASGRARLFLAYWTLKESYAKARGEGVALPFDKFSFRVEKGTIGVVLDPSLADAATGWRFALLNAAPRHVIAVAARTLGVPLKLRPRCIVPLGDAGGEEPLDRISKFTWESESGMINS